MAIKKFTTLFDNDFKWQAYGTGRADGFALLAPTAVISLDDGYHILRHDQGLTQAHTNT